MNRNAAQAQVASLLRRYGEDVEACELAIQRPSTTASHHGGSSSGRGRRRNQKRYDYEDNQQNNDSDDNEGAGNSNATERVKARIVAVGCPSSLAGRGGGDASSGGGIRSGMGAVHDGQRSTIVGYVYLFSDDVVEPTANTTASTVELQSVIDSDDDGNDTNSPQRNGGRSGGGVSLQLRSRVDLRKLIDVYAPDSLDDRPNLLNSTNNGTDPMSADNVRATQREDRRRRRSITGNTLDRLDDDDENSNVKCHLELFLADSKKPHVVLSFESPLQRGAVVTVLHRLVRMGGSFDQRQRILGASAHKPIDDEDEDSDGQKLSRRTSNLGKAGGVKTTNHISIDPAVLSAFGGIGGAAFEHQQLLEQMALSLQFKSGGGVTTTAPADSNDTASTKKQSSSTPPTSRLFDDITVFQKILDLKSQQSELHSIGALVGTKALWSQMATRTARLIEVVERVDERIASYAKEVLSRKSIIESIEHKNIELHRTERNLSILHKRMSGLQDALSLSSDMVNVITALMRISDGDQKDSIQRQREQFLSGKDRLPSTTNGIEDGLADLSEYMNRFARDGTVSEIPTPHDSLVDFFMLGGGGGAAASAIRSFAIDDTPSSSSANNNVIQLCAAMTKMGSVLHGADHGNSRQVQLDRTTQQSRGPSRGGDNLIETFPVLAVAQRRRYFVELRRFIVRSTKTYLVTLFEVYERFIKWVSDVAISSGKHRGRLPTTLEKMSKQQRKEFALFQRFGFICAPKDGSMGGLDLGAGGGGRSSFPDGPEALHLGDPVISKQFCLVLRHHNELHTRLAAVQPILSTMRGVDPEGFQLLLRRYSAIMRVAYLTELRSFMREVKECIKKVGWQQQRDHQHIHNSASSSSSRPRSSSTSGGRAASVGEAVDESFTKMKRSIGNLHPRSAAAGVVGHITGALSVSSQAAYINATHPVGGYLSGAPVVARAVREPSILGAPPAGVFADALYAGTSQETERAEAFQHLLESNEAGFQTPMPGIFGGGLSLEGLREGGVGGGNGIRGASVTPQRSVLHSRSNSVPGIQWGTSTPGNGLTSSQHAPSRCVAGRLAGEWIPSDHPSTPSNPFLPMSPSPFSSNADGTATSSYSTLAIETITSRSVVGSGKSGGAGGGSLRGGSDSGQTDGGGAEGGLFISVPETHLGGVRLHKPQSAKGTISQASSMQISTSVLGGTIDTLRGKTGGGVIRPDIAFGMVLEAVVDLVLSEEIIIRQIFGLGALPSPSASSNPPTYNSRPIAPSSSGNAQTSWLEEETKLDPQSCQIRHGAMREIFAGDALVTPSDKKVERINIGLGIREGGGRGPSTRAGGASANGLVDDEEDEYLAASSAVLKNKGGNRRSTANLRSTARKSVFGAAKTIDALTERGEGWRSHITSNTYGEDELDPNGVLRGGSGDDSEDAVFVADSDAVSSEGDGGGGGDARGEADIEAAESKRERRLRILANAESTSAKKHLLQRNVPKEELYSLVSEVFVKKCDRVYIPAMLAMVESMLFGGAPPSSTAVNGAANSTMMSTLNGTGSGVFNPPTAMLNAISRQTLIHKSPFCLNFLDKIYRKLKNAMQAFVTDQVSSILYSAHFFLKEPSALLSCFSRLPMLLLRVETTHHALDVSTRSYRHMDGFVIRMVDYCYNVLDQVSLVSATASSTGGSGGSASIMPSSSDFMVGDGGSVGGGAGSIGLQLTPPSKLDSTDGTITAAKSGSSSGTSWWATMTAHNPKRVMKGYLMQYRHNAFFCCVFAGLPRSARCRELLMTRFTQASFARDHYEELYLTRLIFADAFPHFSRFVSTAEDLFQTYKLEELNHNKALSKVIVSEALKELPAEIKNGIASAATRIKKHFTGDVRFGTTDEAFHKAILKQTWQHFGRLIKGKVAFLEKRLLVELAHLSGLQTPVTSEDVEHWLKKTSVES